MLFKTRVTFKNVSAYLADFCLVIIFMDSTTPGTLSCSNWNAKKQKQSKDIDGSITD